MDDPDETEGRRLYRARAEFTAKVDIALSERRIRIAGQGALK